MNTGIFNRLMAKQKFTLSAIVGMVLLATFTFFVTAQAATTQTPATVLVAIDSASSVPATIDSASAVSANAAPKTTQKIRKTFDHLRTGFALTGAHIAVSCETCHVSGTFKGTPKDCAGCHTQGRLIEATPKDQKHIQTTKACDACHISTATFRSWVMDHTGLTQQCEFCHSPGNSDIGIKSKSSVPNHLATTQPCDSCHKNTSSFLGAGFNHKDENGNPTNSGCKNSNCHGTPAGAGAQGQPSPSIHPFNYAPYPVEDKCEVCHKPSTTSNFTTFLGASISHDTFTVGCGTCHDGHTTGVLGKSTGHISIGSAACETCHTPQVTPGWPYPSAFLGAIFDHKGYEIGTNTCSTCHGVSAGVKAKSTSHIAIKSGLNCDACHTSTSTFTAWTMQHQLNNNTTGCVTCHKASGDTKIDSATVLGKPNTHIATVDTCESCHTSTSPGGFSIWTMSHNGITNNCASCHVVGGVDKVVASATIKSQPAYPSHIKNTAVCEKCHSPSNTGTGGFATWTMDHTAVTPTLTCASCHDTNAPALPSLVTKPDFSNAGGHVPYAASVDCGSCHKNTNSFTSWLPSDVHSNSGKACTDCHSPTGATFKDVTIVTYVDHSQYTPLATSATDCSGCHNTTTFLGATNGHDVSAAGVLAATNNCASCHKNGGAGKMFVPGTHIPSGTSPAKGAAGQCDNCHTNGFKTFSFEGATMNHTTGYPSGTRCDACHISTFATEHVVAVPTTGGGHIAIPSGVDCAACHSTGNFTGWQASDVHKAVGATATSTTTKCDSCHGSGKIFYNATVKTLPSVPSAHISYNTGADCVDCHNSLTTFASPVMGATGHSKVNTLSCATCHDTSATVPSSVVVKPNTGTSGHIAYQSGTTCDTCHGTGYSSFATWTMGSAGHSNVSLTCSSCHATGANFKNVSMVTFVDHSSFTPNTLQNPSPTTTADCAVCHNTTTFFGSTGGHDATTKGIADAKNNCASCHKTGGTGKALPTGLSHIPTGTPTTQGGVGQCDICHTVSYSTFSFAGATMSHAAGAYPSSKTCADCHSGTYQPVGVKSLTDASPHVTIPSGTDCGSCHKSTSNFAIWQSSDVHATVGATANSTTTACNSCHGSGKTFFNVTLKTLPSTPSAHISYNAGADCIDCHNSLTTFASPVMGATGHSKVNTLSCATCHDTSATVPSSVVVKPNTGTSGHIAYNSGTTCDTCHGTGYSGFATWTMGSAGHNNVSLTCSTCHATGANFKNVSMVTFVDHSTFTPTPSPTTTADCAVCHNTTTFFGSTGGHDATTKGIADAKNNCASCHKTGGTGKALPTGLSHIPTGTPTTQGGVGQCDICHTVSYSTFSFAGATMSHAAGAYPSSKTCADCHSGTYQSIGVKSLTDASPHVTIPSGTDCGSCHKSTSNFAIWQSSDVHAAVGATANSTTTVCSSCHGSGKTFFNATMKTLPAQPTAHINFNSGTDCVVCHNSLTTFATPNMGATGHNAANLTSCATCHDTGASVPSSVTIKPPTAATGSSGATLHVNLSGAASTCDSCHGKGYTTFSTWTMGATGHNYVAGTCVNCHTTTAAFKNATLVTYPVNHDAVAKANSNLTVSTTSTTDCSTCHSSYVNFLTVSNGHFSAVNDAGDCATACHKTGGTGLMYKAGTHIPTGTPAAKGSLGQCDACHTASYTTFSFAGAVMNHTSGYPNGTRCDACHIPAFASEGVKTTAATTHITIPSGSDCSDCHKNTTSFTGTLASDVHTKVNAGTSPYTCASCHDNTHSYTGVVVKPAAATAHIAYNATGIDCNVCHIGASGMTSFVPQTMSTAGHAAVATAVPLCSTCHDTSAVVPVSVVKMPATSATPSAAKHIAFTAGTSCDTCHGKGYVSFANSTMASTGHAKVTTDCKSCHTPSGATFYNASLVTFPASGHPYAASTSVCSTCHTSFTSFLGATSGHAAGATAANANNCASAGCHSGTGAIVKVFTSPMHIPSSTAGAVITGAATGQCDNCHTSSYTSLTFAGAVMSHATGAYPATLKCSDCHSPAGAYASEGVKSLPASGHIPFGTSLCSTCHTSTTTFTGWLASTVHTTVGATIASSTTRCDVCHGATSYTGVVSKPTAANAHILYNSGLDCNSCHTSLTSFTSWTMGTTGHTNVATAVPLCSTCHDTGKVFPSVVVMPATSATPSATAHIAFTAGTSCDTCHGKGYVSFANSTMASTGHAKVTTDCKSCHTPSGATFYNVSLVTFPASGHPYAASTSVCSTCHTSFTSFLGATSGHAAGATAANANNCASAGCHSGTGAIVKVFTSPMHIPSSTAGAVITGAATGQCDNCHTSSYTSLTFAGAVMSHATGAYPATLKCSDCHSPAGAYASEGVKSLPASGHIPFGTSLCSTCHTGTTTFTGWLASTVHTTVGATIASSATRCDVCHGATSYTGVVSKPTAANAHISYNSGLDCNSCHTSLTSFTSWTMGTTGHTNVATAVPLCSTCHDTGKVFPSVVVMPATSATPSATAHIAFTAGTSCDTCHGKGYVSFANSTMASTGHAKVTTDCKSCHTPSGATFYNASLVTFPASGHPYAASTSVCSTCHTSFTSFLGATSGHAAGATAANANNCASAGCHSGTGAIVKVFTSPMHIPSSTAGAVITGATIGQCDNCHTSSYTSLTFAGAVMSHATGAYPATLKCSDCHSPAGAYASEGVKSLPASGHIPFGTSLCSTCHTGTTTFTGWLASTVHTTVGATIASSTTRCDVCHGATSYTGVVSKPTAANAHIAYNSGLDCNSCHTSLTSFTSWTMGTTGHTNVATAVPLCSTCHDTGKVFPSVVVKAASPGHIPYNAGLDCSACHTDKTTFTKWSTGTTLHTAVGTAYPLCASCHDTTAPAYPSVVKKLSSHMSGYPTEDCKVCHTSTNTGNYTSFLGMDMKGMPGHTGMSSATVCKGCHNGVTALGTISYPSHVAIGTSDCTSCHALSIPNFTSFSGGANGHSGNAADLNSCATTCHKTGGSGKVFTSQHIPSSTPGASIAAGAAGQCNGCHAGAYASMSFATYTAANIHTATNWTSSALLCSACHNGLYTGEGSIGAQAKTMVNHIPTTFVDTLGLDCKACHNKTIAITISSDGFITGEKMEHNKLAGNTAAGFCATCHIDTSPYFSSTGMKKISTKTAHHKNAVAPTVGHDCTFCHNKGNYSSWP